MTKLVISQPNYLPWSGMFEQVKLSDVFIFYDDVQLPKGGGKGRGFITRVQIKTMKGWEWISIPVDRSQGKLQLIKDVRFANQEWRIKHQSILVSAYKSAPYFRQIMEEIVLPIYQFRTDYLSEFCVYSMRCVFEYLGLAPNIHISSELPISSGMDPSERVLAYCCHFGVDEYITGHGASNYLRHHIFEEEKVKVKYMDYSLTQYPQLHGPFNPYVSILDLLFNTGKEAAGYLMPKVIYWKDFDGTQARVGQ